MTKDNHPIYDYSRAGLDLLSTLGQTVNWLALPDQPLSGATISDDFFGVNLAPGEDPAVDDYILAQLSELGLLHVRMDFSYCSFEGPAERLLHRLLGAGYRVFLNLLPPLVEAQNLTRDTDAQDRWMQFLRRVFHCYQNQVACFEIGNTPNRGRWSGFSSRSYITAWRIATAEAEGVELTLAGPNISDFEPLYNATYLAIMARFGRAPEIHTDNLFVERVIEPEAYDHRVLGRGATNLLRLNLIKKARILHLIGQRAGCEKTFCTYICWTTKRLARRSAWPDIKAADYLVRYLVLAATSGALGRVYWGPLICSRDGLIDSQDSAYPEIDQVSFYKEVRGQLNDFTIRPTFRALHHSIKRLGGAHCELATHQPNGLSLFKFSDRQGEAFHLCWTRDRLTWPLESIFDGQSLSSARFFDASGKPVKRPTVICEHPLYIEFTDAEINPDLATAQGAASPGIIHLSSPGHQSIAHRDSEWIGAHMLRREHQLNDLDSAPSLFPEALLQLPEDAVLRDARNRLWNVQDPRGIYDAITIKLNRVTGIKRLSYRFRPSKGRRHWNNACEMLRRGIRTPTPIAFFDRPKSPGIRDSWYVCEFIPEAISSRQVYAALREGSIEFLGLTKDGWFDLLSKFICHMHDKQVLHRDLSAGNILLRRKPNGSIEPLLIDIGRAQVGQTTRLGDRHRLIDLIRICYKLRWPDRNLFIDTYESHMGRTFSPLWRIPFVYYDSKQGLKKWIKGSKKRPGPAQ
ncbi:MAG: hypothetical protein HOC23_19065 [Halieaceae bacterium]|nr:hypothetical protein [Halieaceae bacterium]